MKIKKIQIENYRGIKDKQIIPLSDFSSIVGKNDTGKSIILNAIATFLDVKNYPIVESDFNDSENPIIIICYFADDNLKQLIENKVKTKIKKNEGLDDFLEDIIIEDSIVIKKTIRQIGKKLKLKKF